MTTGVYDVSYRTINGEPIIYLFSRDKENKKHVDRIKGFKPYIYIDKKFESILKVKELKYESVQQKTIYNKDVLKIIMNNPSEVYSLKKELELMKVNPYTDLFESDILFDLRYVIDNINDNEPSDYKIATLDIETDCLNGFPKYENPVESIICGSLSDNYSKELHTFIWRDDYEEQNVDNIHYFKTEQRMLEKLIELWRNIDADIMIGWNLQFDIKYLISRLNYLKIDINKLSLIDDKLDKIDNKYKSSLNNSVRIRPQGEAEILGLVLFDLLKAYKKMHFGELTSYSLNNISSDELGEEKEKVYNTGEVWRKDPEKLISYNRKDVELTFRINQKCKLTKIFEDIKNFAGVRNINDDFFASRIHESRMMKKFRDKYIFPTKPPFKEKDETTRIKGALVRNPIPGLYSNIICLDAKSLYPSLIYTFNLSKEMIHRDGALINGIKIKQSPKGIMPNMIKELIELKDKMKEEVEGTGQDLSDKMFAIKTFINSFYGINALSSFRLYDKGIAENITYLGREVSKRAALLIEEQFKVKVIYGDTDSLFIQLETFSNDDKIQASYLKKRGKEIQLYINNMLPNIIKELGGEDFDSNLFIEFEKIYKKIMFPKLSNAEAGAKKRYVGHIIWDSEKDRDIIKIAGMAARRSDVSAISKKIQKQILEMLLRGSSGDDITIKIKEYMLSIFSNEVDMEDFALPVKLNKASEEYKIQNTPKIRGIKWSKDNLGLSFNSGTKFKMIYVINNSTNVVCFEESSQIKNIKIDWDMMFDKCIFQKIKTIYETMKWDREYKELEDFSKKLTQGQKTLDIFKQLK